MSLNFFGNIPIAPGALPTNLMSAQKCITATGTFGKGEVLSVEVSPNGTVWDNVAQFDGPGVRYIEAIAFQMRYRRVAGSAGTVSIDVGSPESCDCAPID